MFFLSTQMAMLVEKFS